MAFAIKAEVCDPEAKAFAFTAQKTMYGGTSSYFKYEGMKMPRVMMLQITPRQAWIVCTSFDRAHDASLSSSVVSVTRW